MKTYKWIFITALLFSKVSQGQESAPSKQRAFVFSPFDQGMGYRSNLHQKSFFDLELRYSLVLGALKFEPELSWKRRTVNKPNQKFYWGAGVSFKYIFPQIIFPIGMEILPFDKLGNVSFFVEAVPSLVFIGSAGLKGKSNFGIAYYFDRKP